MDERRLDRIKGAVESALFFANKVLRGDAEYSGADGAQEVRDMCEYCDELIKAMEKGKK